MRIGKVKKTDFGKDQYYKDDDIDRITKMKQCLHCKDDRITLSSTTNELNIMMVCINVKCFQYVDITKLTHWIKKDVEEETTNGYESTSELESD